MPLETTPPPFRRFTRRAYQLCYYGFAGFLLLAALGGASQQPTFAPLEQPNSPRAVGQPMAVQNGTSPLDAPLRMIGEARTVFEDIKDYSCVLVKRERINGQLTPNHVVAMKVRNQPFSVYMKWMEPSDLAGQEVAFVAGKHGTKMRVHPAGPLGLVGWISIDQKDPRALKTSRHAISEAGLANLIERYTKGWEAERSLGITKVNMAEYEYNKRRCTRVETVHDTDTVGQFEYYRTVVFFDKESKLPIRVECYDYPNSGNKEGDLVEMYSYLNLRYNPGLGEETFNR